MAPSCDDLGTANMEREWRRLGKLGMEEYLRERGIPEERIATVSRVDSSGKIDTECLDTATTTLEENVAFYAMIGRGSGKTLDLASRGKMMNEFQVAALCVNLSANTNIQELKLDGQRLFGHVQGCTLLGNALRRNFTLKSLSLTNVTMGSEGVRCVLNGLHENKTLVSLDLSGNPLQQEGIKSVEQFLTKNTTLKELGIAWTLGGNAGAEHLSSALESNSTLEKLRVGGEVGNDGMKSLLAPLSERVKGKNTSLKSLSFLSASSNESSVESLASMIRSNKSLRTLDLRDADFLPEDWKVHIFPALRRNESLLELNLDGCRGLTGKNVLNTLMDVLRSGCTGLTKVNLHASGVESWQARVDEEIRVNTEYRAKLRSQSTVPTRSGRLVLCGYGFAGGSLLNLKRFGLIMCAQVTSNSGFLLSTRSYKDDTVTVHWVKIPGRFQLG